MQKLAEQSVQFIFSCTQISELGRCQGHLEHDSTSKNNQFQVSVILPNTHSNNRQGNKELKNQPRQTEAQPARGKQNGT